MAEFHLIISCYVDLALFFSFVCVCRNDICYLLFCGESGCPVVDQLIDIHSCIWFWFKVVMMSRFWPFFFIINNKKIFLERGKTSFTSNVNKRFFWRLQFQIQKIIWKYKKEEIYYFLKLNASRVENSSPSKWSKWFAWGKRDNISNETDSVLATHPLSSQEPDVSNGDVQGLNPHPPLNNVYRKEKQPLPTKSTSRTFDFYCQPLNPKQGEYWWSHLSFYRTM